MCAPFNYKFTEATSGNGLVHHLCLVEVIRKRTKRDSFNYVIDFDYPRCAGLVSSEQGSRLRELFVFSPKIQALFELLGSVIGNEIHL